MRRFWKSVVEPLLTACDPEVIVEVGAGAGAVTERLIAYATGTGAAVHSIDPKPEFDPGALPGVEEVAFEFHRVPSLDVLGEIAKVDLALLDGDHNWYTVINELRLLERRAADDGRPFPIVLLHDIDWPYGRRDLYYDPDLIPPAYRHPLAKAGLRPGEAELSPEGLNSRLQHAIQEGGPRNGVRTAIEDFLAESAHEIELLEVHGHHGLGVLLAAEILERKPVGRERRRLRSIRFLREQLDSVEADRTQMLTDWARLSLDLQERSDEIRQLEERFTSLRSELERSDGVRQTLRGELESSEARLRELRSSHDRETAELKQGLDATERGLRQAAENRSRLEQQLGSDRELRGRLEERIAQLSGALDAERERGKELRLAEELVGELRDERERLAKELDRISASRAWRLGHAITSLLRWLTFRPPRTQGAPTALARQLRDRSVPALPPPHPSRAEGANGDEDRDRGWVEMGVAEVEQLRHRRPVSVVIPIHNAPDELERCMTSLIRNTRGADEVILIDDRSTDPRIQAQLSDYAQLDGVRVISNIDNLGFAGSVNLGIREAGETDVVVLNSDVEVTPQWLQNLSFAAYSREGVATVTPLSNNAGAFSAPTVGEPNGFPRGISRDGVGRLVTRSSRRLYPEIPTASGFCMYITRGAVRAIGDFDARTYPEGYGEEGDFCMRAKRGGWTNLLDDATLIFHARQASFGERREELVRAARRRVDARFPEYSEEVQGFLASPEVARARESVAEAYSREGPGADLPRVLFVFHDGKGGVPQTSLDLATAIESSYECFALTSNAQRLRLSKLEDGRLTELGHWPLDPPWRLMDRTREDYRRVVASVLRSYAIDLVHVRHLFKHTFDLPELATTLGIPVVISFHDYYFSCPTVQLLDERGRYCGGACTPGDGKCLMPSSLLEHVPPLKHRWVYEWRRQVNQMLEHVDTAVTTSEHARDVYRRSLSGLEELPFEVIEHGRDLPQAVGTFTVPTEGGPVRILIAGNLNLHKGGELVRALTALDLDRRLEFHALGGVESQYAELVIEHGAYERDQFIERVKEIRPSFIGCFSATGETYSHVLTEAWAAGVPVLTSDIGTLRERVLRHGGGWLIDHRDPAAAYAQILRICEDQAGYREVAEQANLDRIPSTREMGQRYDLVYRRALRRDRSVVASEPTAPLRWADRNVLRMGLFALGHGDTRPGSTHVRCLSRLNHPLVRDKVVSTEETIERFLDEVEERDLLMVQRNAVPADLLESFLDAVTERELPVVFELDDNLLEEKALPEVSAHYRSVAESLRVLARASAVTTVTTKALEKVAQRHAERVEVVPNMLDERLWIRGSSETGGSPPAPGDRPIRALYMGTVTHGQDLRLLEPVFARLHDQGLEVELEVIGGEPLSEDEWYSRLKVPAGYSTYPRFVPWLRSMRERWDFAVAPLRDTPFNRCKSDIKFLEYSALGLPGAFSDIGVYSTCTDDSGLLVPNQTDAWYEAVRALALDMELRTHLAENARSYVVENRLLADGAAPYLEVLTSAASGRVTIADSFQDDELVSPQEAETG